MAASRIARLTLFSGPQCSLCEIAKAELAKVKKQREFDLEVINIQGKGQEKWKKKYVYWIPALHLDGVEIAKGRWDASTVLEALKQREAKPHPSEKSTEYGPNDCFIVDTTSSVYPSSLSLWHSCLYDKIPGDAFGEEADDLLPSAARDLRLCFNCGSPNHAVASCSKPINRQLVSLSRQLFNFLHPDPGRQEFTRFYVAEGWKQQRLEWLRSYEPGVICGPLLRDALGLQEGDLGNAVEWLRNMAYWGYPPGWVGRRDPTELVCYRILEDGVEVERQAATTEWDSFTIFEGADDDEEIDLRLFNLNGPSVTTAGSLTTSVDEERTRWAIYPDTYFSSTTLSIYNGIPLDRVAPSPSRVSVTFTPERSALWERILSGGLGTSNILSVPPWRMPGAFGGSRSLEYAVEDFTPPPPSTTPPPLPSTPSSPLHTFTPPRCLVPYGESTPSSRSERMIDIADDRSVVDMDVSDDSE